MRRGYLEKVESIEGRVGVVVVMVAGEHSNREG